MCLDTTYMILTIIISSLKNTKKLDMYFELLIDELKIVWQQGLIP